MTAPIDFHIWRTSSYSGVGDGDDSNCVEISFGRNDFTGIRDSKAPQQGHLAVRAPAWRAFLQQAQG
ncbi:uncharacterized protein DUF397 [Herbihabitans rhizosphaerae]|uniref:Uncharacterized protein DUF397 n=1 Tax=Herbihabitans rhizosphaerae TaxID=1872711 RepID=A0A4Q7KJX4_9PSEU|nr:DUF397 domain-containing protein [Herbihabitans rhizosphaerae]RZS36888.1 uncharacterized protein DUF397 [Herbihabitans rhizosphaerae]